jgi:hypothetical protein
MEISDLFGAFQPLGRRGEGIPAASMPFSLFSDTGGPLHIHQSLTHSLTHSPPGGLPKMAQAV